MIEIRLCATCAATPCKCEQACSICTEYSLRRLMILKSDNRRVCLKCDGNLQRLATAKAQGDLFVTQPQLF